MLRVLTLSTLYPDAARPGFGGFVERQTLALAAADQVELRVVAPVGIAPGLARHRHYRDRADLPDREQWNGLTVHRPRFPAMPGPLATAVPMLMARRLLSVLRDVRAAFAFEVIDAEFFWPDGPAAIWLGRRLGVPVSIKARGSDIAYWGARRLPRRAMVDAARQADGLLAVSAALRDRMAGIGMPGERVRVHYTGVDLGRFHPGDRAALKADLGVSGPVVASVGNLTRHKGHHLAVEAVARLPGITLLIAGDGAERPALEKQIAALGIGDRARLLGPLPHDRLPRLMAAADVLALPSAGEGLANVWVEALACGTPVVTTDVGGAREVIGRPDAGRLVPRTAEAFADAISAILAARPPQEVVREAALRFGWARNTAELVDHLSGLVESHRHRENPMT